MEWTVEVKLYGDDWNFLIYPARWSFWQCINEQP